MFALECAGKLKPEVSALAISEESIDRLAEAAASPEQEVRDGRRQVTYRPVGETLEALRFARGEKARAERRRVRGFRMYLRNPDC